MRLLLAALANGAMRSALETAAAYMATRVQFGRPLSAKQAVRHPGAHEAVAGSLGSSHPACTPPR